MFEFLMILIYVCRVRGQIPGFLTQVFDRLPNLYCLLLGNETRSFLGDLGDFVPFLNDFTFTLCCFYVVEILLLLSNVRKAELLDFDGETHISMYVYFIDGTKDGKLTVPNIHICLSPFIFSSLPHLLLHQTFNAVYLELPQVSFSSASKLTYVYVTRACLFMCNGSDHLTFLQGR